MSFPRILGFKIVKVLGDGATGVVFSALRDKDNLKTAVKVLEPLSINREYLIDIYTKIKSYGAGKGVVEVVGFNLNNNPPYIATKFFNGINLQGQTATSLEDVCGKLEEDEAWGLVREIASTMSFWHGKGIAHSSLKLSNILLDEQEPLKPKITDFGLGWLGNIYHIGFTDSFYYCPPEQIQFPKNIFKGHGYSWDVYSFGVMAYRLITGLFPRGNDKFTTSPDDDKNNATIDAGEIIQTITSEREVKWPKTTSNIVHNELREIIIRCLSLDSNVRFSNLRELESAFNSVLAQDKIRQEKLLLGKMQKVTDLKLNKSRQLNFALAVIIIIVGFLSLDNYFKKKENDKLLLQLLNEREEAQKQHNQEIMQFRESAERELQNSIKNSKNEVETAKKMLILAEMRNLNYYDKLKYSEEVTEKLFNIIKNFKENTEPGFKRFPEILTELENYYTKYLEENKNKVGYEISIARAYNFLTEISIAKSESQKAKEYCQKAIELWNKLLKRDQNNYVYQNHILNAKNNLVQLLKDENKISEAQDVSLELEESLLKYFEKSGDKPNLIKIFLDNRMLQANFALQQGDSKKYLKLLKETLKDKIIIALNSPNNKTEIAGNKLTKNDLEEINAKLSQINSLIVEELEISGSAEEAESYRQEGKKTLKKLLDENPNLVKQKLDFANLLAETAKVYEIDIQSSTFLDKNQSAIKIIEKEIDTIPEKYQNNARLLLARFYRNLSISERAKDGSQNAIPHAKKALNYLTEGKDWQTFNPHYSLELALCLSELAMQESDIEDNKNSQLHAEKAESLFDAIKSEDKLKLGRKLYRDYLYGSADFFSFYALQKETLKDKNSAKKYYQIAKEKLETVKKEYQNESLDEDTSEILQSLKDKINSF